MRIASVNGNSDGIGRIDWFSHKATKPDIERTARMVSEVLGVPYELIPYLGQDGQARAQDPVETLPRQQSYPIVEVRFNGKHLSRDHPLLFLADPLGIGGLASIVDIGAAMGIWHMKGMQPYNPEWPLFVAYSSSEEQGMKVLEQLAQQHSITYKAMHPFSRENVCDLLGVDVEKIRPR